MKENKNQNKIRSILFPEGSSADSPRTLCSLHPALHSSPYGSLASQFHLPVLGGDRQPAKGQKAVLLYNTSNLTLSLTRLSCIPLSSLPLHAQETLLKAGAALLLYLGKLMLLNNLHFFPPPHVISVSGCSSIPSVLCFSLLALIMLWRMISDVSLSVCFRDAALTEDVSQRQGAGEDFSRGLAHPSVAKGTTELSGFPSCQPTNANRHLIVVKGRGKRGKGRQVSTVTAKDHV